MTGRFLTKVSNNSFLAVVAGISIFFCGCTGALKQARQESPTCHEPVRNLSIILLIEKPEHFSEMTALVKKASDSLGDQIGISLSIDNSILTKFSRRSNEDFIKHMTLILEDVQNYDIALAYCEKSFSEKVHSYLFGGVEGFIDDALRRYIVVRRLDEKVLAHEICHAFIFEIEHSSGLLSKKMMFMGSRLNLRDREEALRNKWRTLGKTPVALGRKSLGTVSGRQ